MNLTMICSETFGTFDTYIQNTNTINQGNVDHNINHRISP